MEVIKVEVNFNNPEEVKKAIESYKDFPDMLMGGNPKEESIEISFTESAATVKTYQNNGWVRVNYYNSEGYCEGETFEGRWK